jgi:glycosyltransferase involved in cell wall biosynthesis
MRVAFVGTRGIPASYSGFETFVENLGARLFERGHDVTVYCRKHHFNHALGTYRGMQLIHLGGIATKHLDTISHTSVACLHTLFRRYDVVIMCISGNSPLAAVPRLTGAKVIMNVDGSDWRRRKWGLLARQYIRFSERLAILLPNITVTDTEVMRTYYRERFGAVTECIAYGADMPRPEPTGILQRLQIEPKRYFLLVGRLVPENCAHHLVEAYERLRTQLKCVVVGDAPYASDYIADLRRRGPHVIFPGYVFGEAYRDLMHHAYATILCSEVGGTHPVLLEAMAAGNCVIVNNTPANLEVIGDAGLSYSGTRGADGLLEILEVVASNQRLVDSYRPRAAARIARLYSWDVVADEYERLLRSLNDHVAFTAASTKGID